MAHSRGKATNSSRKSEGARETSRTGSTSSKTSRSTTSPAKNCK